MEQADTALEALAGQAAHVTAVWALRLFGDDRAKAALFAGEYHRAAALYAGSLEGASGFNSVVQTYYHGEALLRAGRLDEAAATLARTLDEAERALLRTLIPEVLERMVWLSLRRADLPAARAHDARREAVLSQLEEKPFEPDLWLLLAESRHDEAIAQASRRVSTTHDDKLDKLTEIAATIVLARAWQGKGDRAKARVWLDRARALMDATGCRRDRDRFEETEALLA